MSNDGLYSAPYKEGDVHFINEMREKQEIKKEVITLRVTKKYDDLFTLIMDGEYEIAMERIKQNGNKLISELVQNMQTGKGCFVKCLKNNCTGDMEPLKNVKNIFVCQKCGHSITFDRNGDHFPMLPFKKNR